MGGCIGKFGELLFLCPPPLVGINGGLDDKTRSSFWAASGKLVASFAISGGLHCAVFLLLACPDCFGFPRGGVVRHEAGGVIGGQGGHPLRGYRDESVDASTYGVAELVVTAAGSSAALQFPLVPPKAVRS